MALPLLVCFVAEVLHLMKALYCFRRPPLLLLYSVLYYTDEWSRLHKSFKILGLLMALPLLVCFAASAEVLHLMKALYCFRRLPLLLLLYSVLYYTDEWSRLYKSFKILRTSAALPLLVCFVALIRQIFTVVKWDSLFLCIYKMTACYNCHTNLGNDLSFNR